MDPVVIKVGFRGVAGKDGAARLPDGIEGQYLGYGAGGVPVAVDAPSGGGYDDTALSARVDEAQADATLALEQIAAFPVPYDDSALAAGVNANADAIANLPAPYDSTALQGRVTTLEDAPAPDVGWDDVDGKPAAFPPSAHTHAFADITGKPSTFPPSAHSHAIADTTGLQTALDGKQPTTAFKTVNGTSITGTGNIVTAVSFATDAEALAYSTANPTAAVFSSQAS
ncbi:hypothetical protein [Paracoccus sp. JM45]|uniref:hypothetical protein n=1 Tax=Paracoccus sp. JM45 TaxID=2283626 RepID=UPI000E6B8218|nr:hypothetical protein [Paracoccus sp. JM45]RJE81267.1 hypothetical protein DWB67_01005 [Paracoccus sp. JM45]